MSHQLKALEQVRDGDWDGAHELVQPHKDTLSCLVHALLHRHEGDRANAEYWYRRAGEEFPDNSLDQEWQRLHDLASAL